MVVVVMVVLGLEPFSRFHGESILAIVAPTCRGKVVQIQELEEVYLCPTTIFSGEEKGLQSEEGFYTVPCRRGNLPSFIFHTPIFLCQFPLHSLSPVGLFDSAVSQSWPSGSEWRPP